MVLAGGFSNFDGMALGPRLDDGSTSLLLIADDNGAQGQALYRLKLVFAPEHGPAARGPSRSPIGLLLLHLIGT